MSMKLILKETQHFTGALVVSQAHRSQGGHLRILPWWSLNFKSPILALSKRVLIVFVFVQDCVAPSQEWCQSFPGEQTRAHTNT
jgi:hypothetical protein